MTRAENDIGMTLRLSERSAGHNGNSHQLNEIETHDVRKNVELSGSGSKERLRRGEKRKEGMGLIEF